MSRIYLDHAATTGMSPEVLDAMMPFFGSAYGNPSSIHGAGREARLAIDEARETAAELLNCDPSALIFTSGGTESNNASLFGVTFAQNSNKLHLIVSGIEHQAVLETAHQLSRMQVEITIVPPDEHGFIHPERIEEAIRPDTVLISVMAGNNETGVIQPVEAIGNIARSRGVLFHVDAVQALGWIPLDLKKMPVDLVSFSGHKIHGPKGIGMLYMHRAVKWLPYLYGGSQERKRRAGTENVPGIIGFAKALEHAIPERGRRVERVSHLRNWMDSALREALGEDAVIRNSLMAGGLPHILNLSFPWMDTETMLMNLDLEGICASSGSACSSGSFQPSHVLKAMNLPDERTKTAVRFSFAESNTIDELNRVVLVIKRLYDRSGSRMKGGGSVGR